LLSGSEGSFVQLSRGSDQTEQPEEFDPTTTSHNNISA